MKENATAQELAARLTELNGHREKLISRHATAQAKIDHAKQERDKIVAEMTELGTSPETLAHDLQLAQTDLRNVVSQYETELGEFEESLKQAESILNS